MRWVRTVAAEVFGLLVDDGSFAVAILAWLLLVWLAVPRIGVGPGWAAAGFFLGLVTILLESVTRRARRSRQAKLAKVLNRYVEDPGT